MQPLVCSFLLFGVIRGVLLPLCYSGLRSFIYIWLCLSLARVDRMKEAKSEAEQIISAYRAEMEAKYQTSLAAVSEIKF